MSSIGLSLIVVFKRADDARKFASYWARKGPDKSGLRERGWPEHHEWLNTGCKQRGTLVRVRGDLSPSVVVSKLVPELQRRAALMIVDAFHSAVGETEKWFAVAGEEATAEQAMARARGLRLGPSVMREVTQHCSDEERDEEDDYEPVIIHKSQPRARKLAPPRARYSQLRDALRDLELSLVLDYSFPFGLTAPPTRLVAAYVLKRFEVRDLLRKIELLIEGGLEVRESDAPALRWLSGGSRGIQKLLNQRGVARTRRAPKELPRDPAWWLLCLALRHYDRALALRSCVELCKQEPLAFVAQSEWVMLELCAWPEIPGYPALEIEAHVSALGDECLTVLMKQHERVKRDPAAWKHFKEVLAGLASGGRPYARLAARIKKILREQTKR